MKSALTGGFSEPSTQTARAFREILEAMARPGRIVTVAGASPPSPLSIAAGVALLVLADSDTPVYLAGSMDTDEVRAWIAFHSGAAGADAGHAMLALGRWEALQPVSRFCPGVPDYPDRSATLLIEVDRLEADGVRLSGPGIQGEARLGLPETAAFQANRERFPLGFDCLFCCGDRIAALPRSTRVEDY
jgi:alpha-D-ribose 1-methylphosphonate 5-triphosphate synthase subunit PhnH